MRHVSAVHLRLCMGALPRPVREVLHHLLACPPCAAAAASRIAAEPADGEPCAPDLPAEGDSTFDRVFDRLQRQLVAAQAVHAVHRRRAGALVRDLLAEPPATWPDRLARDPELATVEVAQTLLERSRSSLPGDPAGTLAGARLTLAVLDRIDAAAAASEIIVRLRLRAWALLGHALALAGDGPGSDAAFAEASHLGPGLLGSEEEAELLERHALALWRQGLLSQALAQLARSADVAAALGDLPRAMRTLVRLGLLHLDLADLERSAQQLAWALLYAEELDDREAANFLRHRLAWVLLADDQVEAASDVLAAATPSRQRGEFAKLLLLLARKPEEPSERLAALERDLARAHAGGEAFQAGLYALLVARELVRSARAPELAPLAPYVLEAAGSPELAPGSRAALQRLAHALGEGAASLPQIIETARAIRYDGDPAPADDLFH